MLVLVASLALVASAAFARAAPVALVTDVVGHAEQGGEALRILAEIDAGREIALQRDATVVVFYLADGNEWTLRGPGRYRLAAKAPEATAAGTPQATRRPGPPAYRDIRLRANRLQQGGLVMRAGAMDEPMMLVAPVKGEVLLSPDVVFRWMPLDGARVYQFELVDRAGRKLVATETAETRFAPPPSVRLEPGRTYYWAVRAHGPTAAQPTFRLAEFTVADEVVRRRLDAARPKPDAPFAERALFVALLEDVGARSEAGQERARLAAERPAEWVRR
jgi:hypothetical protein